MREVKLLWCYDCGGVEPHTHQCSNKALFCHGGGSNETGSNTTLKGQEAGSGGHTAGYRTDYSKTMGWNELVPREKILEEQMPIWYAHGDYVINSQANAEMQLDGVVFSIKVGVSDWLPMFLHGTNISELVELLLGVSKETETNGVVVMAMDVCWS